MVAEVGTATTVTVVIPIGPALKNMGRGLRARPFAIQVIPKFSASCCLEVRPLGSDSALESRPPFAASDVRAEIGKVCQQ